MRLSRFKSSGAISRYPLQSCGPNPGPQGFPLLSGLRHGFFIGKEAKNPHLYIIGRKGVKGN
ncbi:hypothetical protein DOS84_00010 [Flavobacterium aquariorum]|uniref:Uncharacterized protein n=1 Tax=Flavobacterium aquariorum TaxID=2217670 RepID=A0A2W7TZV3_9FLAO|nr:hypothetical protein DOS84_00010 [Flavobacterium aquariorum]